MADDFEVVDVTVLSQYSMVWDEDGRCEEQVNGGPWTRRPDMDFGTEGCAVLYAPWLQEAVLNRKQDS